jgi:hypothetical protein
MRHQVDIHQHHARSNVVMRRRIQTKICPVRWPGNPELCSNPQTNRLNIHGDNQQMSARRIPLNWFCEMANLVVGDNGELLEYRHLVSNHKTRATWPHSYGKEFGRLAQGMPGWNTGTNTIFFIKKNQVPHDRAKDVTYGLITTLIRPEKLTNQTGQG